MYVDQNKRSVVVKNLDEEINIEELERLFSKFGLVNKVILLYDKATKKSKG
jgi:RNA recognition motif-containing protein